MSIVHLPTCQMCKWVMRQVRICVREQATRATRATRYRVFKWVRCHAELMWTPGTDQIKAWKKWRAREGFLVDQT
jgi:hypothetical protein